MKKSILLAFLFIGLQVPFSGAFADLCGGNSIIIDGKKIKCTTRADCPPDFGQNEVFCNTGVCPGSEEDQNVCWIEGMGSTKKSKAKSKPKYSK